MKSLTIKRNSWHYKFVDYYNKGDIHEDLCGYIRQFVGCVLLTLFIIAVCACYFGSWVDMFIWMFVSLTQGIWTSAPGTVIPPAITAILCIVGVANFAYKNWREARREEKYRALEAARARGEEPVEPKHIWASIKNKTCFRLHFQ